MGMTDDTRQLFNPLILIYKLLSGSMTLLTINGKSRIYLQTYLRRVAGGVLINISTSNIYLMQYDVLE